MLWALSACAAIAQDATRTSSADAESVAKQLANPIASLVSIPLQLNWEHGVGANDDLRTVTNFQPVIPFSMSERWNLIGRMILPFINQPSLVPGGASTSGTGDILVSGFLSPTTRHGAMWGIGPAISMPTTTDPLLGTGKWSAGPTAVVLEQAGQWTYGALMNHLWSFADTGDVEREDVSLTYLQPFISHTTKSALTLGLNSEASRNWKASGGEAWTVPINFSVSKVTHLGPFPFSIAVGAGYYIEKPDGGPAWKLRLVGTLILPKAR